MLDETGDQAHDSSMQTIQPVKRGGRRVGAGRPKGSGKHGEPTVPVRVPLSLEYEIAALLKRKKLPLYVVGKPSEKPGQ